MMHAPQKMTKPLMLALAEHHEHEARALRNRIKSACCQSCNHWTRAQCKKFEAVPPADVQRTGCDDYEFDEIPF